MVSKADKTEHAASLSDQEFELLQRGLLEWGGPAHCTNEFAVAMGFASVADMLSQCSRIRRKLAAREDLEPIDWARALISTEVAFISDVMGSGAEWSTTTGWSDEATVKILRSIQRKLIRIVASAIRPDNSQG